MERPNHNKNSLQEEIDWIIADIQRIQRHIRGSGQPATATEIEELKKLGQKYAQIIARLEQITNKD